MINSIQELEEYIRTELTKRIHAKLNRPELKDNQYECAHCHNVYEKGLTDAEADDELRNTFPDMDKQDCAIVCDDCYNKIIGTK